MADVVVKLSKQGVKEEQMKEILKTILLMVAISAFGTMVVLFMIDRYKTYQGERLFFQQYYEQHKESNK